MFGENKPINYTFVKVSFAMYSIALKNIIHIHININVVQSYLEFEESY